MNYLNDDEPIKDYEITIRIRNNYLLRAIKDAGYKTPMEFAKKCNVSLEAVYSYIGLKTAPIVNTDGNERWSVRIINIADALNTTPENLFPIQHIRKCLKNNKSTVEASISDVEFLLEQQPLTGEKLISNDELKTKIKTAINSLTPRERDVIVKTFGIEGEKMSCIDVSREWGVSHSRAQQIQKKALRKLRYPLEKKYRLKEYLSND